MCFRKKSFRHSCGISSRYLIDYLSDLFNVSSYSSSKVQKFFFQRFLWKLIKGHIRTFISFIKNHLRILFRCLIKKTLKHFLESSHTISGGNPEGISGAISENNLKKTGWNLKEILNVSLEKLLVEFLKILQRRLFVW